MSDEEITRNVLAKRYWYVRISVHVKVFFQLLRSYFRGINENKNLLGLNLLFVITDQVPFESFIEPIPTKQWIKILIFVGIYGKLNYVLGSYRQFTSQKI